MTSGPLFDARSPETIRDPYPVYARLREVAPVHRTEAGLVVISRYADIAVVLKSKQFGKDFTSRMTKRLGFETMAQPVYQLISRWMLQQDPPDHTRLRGLVVRAFAARRVEEMRPRIQQVVDDAIDRVIDTRRMDVITDFAIRITMTVICDLLGIPEQDRESFLGASRVIRRLLDPVPPTEAEIAEANARNLVLVDYFVRLFEERRRAPREDLLTHLLAAEADGTKLSSDELIANIVLLFGAGYETTVNMLGNGLLALFRTPDQLALMRARPDLAPKAVDEFLRYDSSIQIAGRTALEDVGPLGTERISKGDAVLLLLGSANRDPSVFPDPDRLDIQRDNTRHLSFGGGIHHCLGAQLAKLEGELALETLFRRLPKLALDEPDRPDWMETLLLRGLKSLPASW